MFALVGCDNQTTTVISYPEMSYLSFSGFIIYDADEQLIQEEDVYYIYYYGNNCSACYNIKNEALYTIEFLDENTVYFVKIYTSGDIHEDIPLEGTPSLVRIINGEVDEVFTGGTKVLGALHELS
jgi:hypothetical protein